MDDWGERAPKRLKRLICKVSASTAAKENLPWTSLGDFNCLPNEMIFMTFNWLQIHELGDVALTSSVMHNYVCSYMQTRSGLRKVFHAWKFEKCDHDSCCGKHKPSEIAIFFRKLIAFWPCKTKMNFIAEIILKSNCLLNDECAEQNVFFGTVIQFVIMNWTEPEKVLAHEVLESKSGKRKLLNEVLASPKGLMIEKEKSVRYYYQGLYLASTTKEFNANWFYLILKWQPYCYQVKLLLLLFAPVDDEGQIEWDAFSSAIPNHTPERKVIIHKAIHDIAKVLRSLQNSGIISLNDLMTIIDEMIVFPILWYEQNLCQLIVCAGDEVLQYVLTSYLLSAQYEEFAIFVSLCSHLPICLKRAEVFSELVVRIIGCNDDSSDRLLFLEFFYNYFTEYKGMFPGNQVIQALLQAFRDLFPLRRSRRLTMKRKRTEKHLY